MANLRRELKKNYLLKKVKEIRRTGGKGDIVRAEFFLRRKEVKYVEILE
jgi:hypothetical protein